MACPEEDSKAPGGGGGAIRCSHELYFDEEYEFSAPRFFDFMNSETEEEIRRAELWFEKSGSHAPSPFSMRVKAERFSHSVVPLSDFCDVKPSPETMDRETQEGGNGCGHGWEVPPPVETSQVIPNRVSETVELDPVNCPSVKTESKDSAVLSENCARDQTVPGDHHRACEAASTFAAKNSLAATSEKMPSHLRAVCNETASLSSVAQEVKTPKPRNSVKGSASQCKLKIQPDKEDLGAVPPGTCASLKPGKTTTAKASKPSFAKSNTTATAAAAKDFAHENQAIKKQKLEDGKARQIHSVRNRVFHHKSKPDLRSSADDVERFVSVAELVKRFESKPREVELRSSHSHEDPAPVVQRRPKLLLTRPKQPELQTSHRVRAVRVKSSVELEEEMLAKMPKFKARPLNRKILEGPSLPPPPRSMPNASDHQDLFKALTEAKSPRLHTSLRARPSRVKTSQELEAEEFEKMPKFKARPLNKKIFESKGDIGLFSKPKPQVTIPEEFHFATNERLGPSKPSLADMFDKLSLHSGRSDQKLLVSRITIPNPFNLRTEERGMIKEKQFTQQVLQKFIEEDKARIPKANPYPYTTDYPVIPPKPESKPCTKPEIFQLESLTRHEEELQKKMATMDELEAAAAERRKFKAQPIMKEDPLPLPEKQRKPLTEVHEFVLQVDHRAEDRAEFDKKVKEKEIAYKRQREESEQAKMMEEEKALKQMRKMMVPHARPLPSFANPFLPQKSTKEVTKPKSPKLLVAQRRRQYLR